MPDEYYAQEYIEALERQSSKDSYSTIQKTDSQGEVLSKEDIMAELASVDEIDVKIQKRFYKHPVTNNPTLGREPEILVVNSASTQRAEYAHKLATFNLIPNYERTFVDELGAGKLRAIIKKVFFVALFVGVVGGSLGFGTRFASVYLGQNFHFQENIEQDAQRAYQEMLAGQEALLDLNGEAARQHFIEAHDAFLAMENTLGLFSRGLLKISARFPIQTQASSASYLINAGKLFSMAGLEAAEALTPFNEIQKTVGIIGIDTERGWAFDSPVYLTDAILSSLVRLETAVDYMTQANFQLASVRPQDIPQRYREEVLGIQQQGNAIAALLDQAEPIIDIVLSFLGHDKPKTYLVLFQNASELRATGGFIGTYGLLKFDRGSVEELFIEGIYYPDGQLDVDVIPPEPLRYVTAEWGTRDANWFFDFPTSAEKVMWFYEATGGVRPDGVIALNHLVVEKLLALTGPIELPEYDLTITSENFLELVQQEVEVDYDKELNRPKQILSDLAPKLVERLVANAEYSALPNTLMEGLGRRDIFLYSRDTLVQSFFSEKKWAGEVESPEITPDSISDYLAVVFSNIGGGKADEYTDTEIDTVTRIENDGTIVRTVTISRTHRGGATPYWWYNKPNYSYVRIYVPRGATLISAEGFSRPPLPSTEIDYEGLGYIEDSLLAIIDDSLYKDEGTGVEIFEEAAKTVFGHWLWVPAGDVTRAQVTYRLPNRVTDLSERYELVIQKQSGLDAQYSGSIEEFGHVLSLDTCDVEGLAIMPGQFEFTQTQDVTVRCRIVQE